MKRMALFAVLAGGLWAGIGGGPARSQPRGAWGALQPRWPAVLGERVREYGHRNWIVIADSAYPAQSRAGIETLTTGADQLTVVAAVLEELGKAKHVRPIVRLDAELAHVPEVDAPGVGKYRDDLAKLLGDRKPRGDAHLEIIQALDTAGEKFKVLVLKTTMTIPYTSVFLELDCGYWPPEAEQRLRDAIKAGGK